MRIHPHVANQIKPKTGGSAWTQNTRYTMEQIKSKLTVPPTYRETVMPGYSGHTGNQIIHHTHMLDNAEHATIKQDFLKIRENSINAMLKVIFRSVESNIQFALREISSSVFKLFIWLL